MELVKVLGGYIMKIVFLEAQSLSLIHIFLDAFHKMSKKVQKKTSF